MHLASRIVNIQMFYRNNGYVCPYCSYKEMSGIPRDAYFLAVHIIKEHSEKITEILIDWEI